GPSVDATLPFFQYKVNAVSGGSSASPPAQCPLARRWSSYAKHRSNISCCSASVMASRLPFSRYPRQMYFIGLRLVVGSRLHGCVREIVLYIVVAHHAKSTAEPNYFCVKSAICLERNRRSGSCVARASAVSYDARASGSRPSLRQRSARAECAK